MRTSSTLFILSVVFTSALARTDLSGCTRTEALLADRSGYTTFYWNPEVREQCSILDCGGGRAPPKTNVPGCPQYTGTDPVAVTGWPAEATPYELDAPPAPEAPAPTPAPDAPAPPSPTPDAPPPEDTPLSDASAADDEPVPDAPIPSSEADAPAPSSSRSLSAGPSSSSSRMSTITSAPSASASATRPASASVSDAINEPQENDAGSAARSLVTSGGAVLAAAIVLLAMA